MTQPILYFAYGSNLCFPRLVSRVPSAKFVETGRLLNWQIVFFKRSTDNSGKATLVKQDASVVYGSLFQFALDDLDLLRKAEGWPENYEEKMVDVLTLEGKKKAMTYIGTKAYYDENQIPYDWYIDHIRFGGRQLGLPEEYLKQFDSVRSKPDDNNSRATKERAFLR